MKLFAYSFVFLLAISSAEARPAPPDIRISILKSVSDISLLGQGVTVWDGERNQLLLRHEARAPLIIAWRDLGMRVDDQVLKAERIVVRAKPSTFRVQGKTLKGELEIVRHEGGGLTLVNRLDLENYLVGLINHEISSSWPAESIKSQAVVARTYALFRKAQNKYVDYDLESSTLDQVYRGSDLEDPASRAAVRETEGEVLAAEGDVIAAFYHSCCGGHTEMPQYVWGGNYAGISAVACTYCAQAPAYYWVHEVKVKDLQSRFAKVGISMPSISRLRISRATPFGRTLQLGVAGGGKEIELTGNQVRAALGFENVKSTYFRLADDRQGAGGPLRPETKIRFIGGGNGHGVGMCQWGARGMAEQGYSYKQILKHYYPDAKLVRWRRVS